jgi:hypothetical protein
MRLKALGIPEHNNEGRWAVGFHEEFAPEFIRLSESVRRQILSLAGLLGRFGPQLGRPHADTLKGSKHANMKELRFRAEDGAWRVAFAFDVKRRAILLVGGDKSGISENKFYRSLIDVADRRFQKHQDALAAEEREL